MPDALDFPDIWASLLDRWINADEDSAEFPRLSNRARSLLRQLTPVILVNRIAVLTAPSKWVRTETETHLAELICDVLYEEVGYPVTLSLSVEDPTPESDSEPTIVGKQERVQDIDHRRDLDHGQHRGSDAGAPSSNPEPAPGVQQGFNHSVQHGVQHGDNRGLSAGHAGSAGAPGAAPEINSMDRGMSAPTSYNQGVPGEATDTPERQRQHWEDLTGSHFQQRGAAGGVGTAGNAGGAGNTGGAGDMPAPRGEARDSSENRLNPQYTFDTFVTGSSNQFANAACRAVAEKPAQAYNPLFIWGESGLGKTHLLHAIGHYARELRSGMKVRYISSEEMTNEFVNSVRDGRGEQFKRRYRNLDMLIVDDVQFLQGKESTREEFFHTFNALQQANRQIVLSSDRPPWQLTTLEDRLRTRFEGGLITDVQTPDLETRMAILSKKAQMEGTYLPEDVLELIASRYEKSIRELEGAMIRVTAYCSLSKEPVTKEAAEVALRDIMPDPKDVEVTPQIIIEVITSYFNVTPDELIGKAKHRYLVTARQLAMYLCRELTELPLKEIGGVFGGRDHTTVIYAERKVRTTIQEDRKTFQQIQELTQRIKSRARQ